MKSIGTLESSKTFQLSKNRHLIVYKANKSFSLTENGKSY